MARPGNWFCSCTVVIWLTEKQVPTQEISLGPKIPCDALNVIKELMKNVFLLVKLLLKLSVFAPFIV